MESSEQVSTGQAPSQGAPTAQLLLKPQPLLREQGAQVNNKLQGCFLYSLPQINGRIFIV